MPDRLTALESQCPDEPRGLELAHTNGGHLRPRAVLRPSVLATLIACAFAVLCSVLAAQRANADGGTIGGGTVARLAAPDDTSALIWSANGGYHLRASSGTYVVVDSSTSAPIGPVVAPSQPDLAIANDGTFAYVAATQSTLSDQAIYVIPSATHSPTLVEQVGPGYEVGSTQGGPRLSANGNVLAYLVSHVDSSTRISTVTLHVYNVATGQNTVAGQWSSDTDLSANIPFPNYLYSIDASGTSALINYDRGLGIASLASPRSPRLLSTPGDDASGTPTGTVLGAVSADLSTVVLVQKNRQTGAKLALNVYRSGSGLSPFPLVGGNQCNPPGIGNSRSASSTMSANGRFALCDVLVPATGMTGASQSLYMVDLTDNTAALVDSNSAYVPEWVANDGSSVIFRRDTIGDQFEYLWSRTASSNSPPGATTPPQGGPPLAVTPPQPTQPLPVTVANGGGGGVSGVADPQTGVGACGHPIGGLGADFVAAVNCTAYQTKLEAECAVSVSGFIFLPLKTLKLAKTSKGLLNLSKLKKKFRPAAKLYNKLSLVKYKKNALYPFRTPKEAIDAFLHGGIAYRLIRLFPKLKQSVSAADFNEIALLVADIADLKPCVEAIASGLSA